jgi:heme/copper-type cytochrome/quinol oxidase subunit 2
LIWTIRAGHVVAASRPWKIGVQLSGSPIKAEMRRFNAMPAIIISLIVLVVLALLIFVLLRLSADLAPYSQHYARSDLNLGIRS